MTSAIVANESEESQFKLGAQEGLETQPRHEISGNLRVDEIVTFSDIFRGWRKDALGTNGINLFWLSACFPGFSDF